MKGERTLRILERIGEAITSTGALVDIFLTDYHTSYRRLRQPMLHAPSPRARRAAYETRERECVYKLISKLKREGFLTSSAPHRWQLTGKGRNLKEKLIARVKARLPHHTAYPAAPAKELKLIIFDIPERERRKRAWLRAALKHLGFTMLQRSVWIGKATLPDAFLKDIRRLRLLPAVEILAVTKTGSIRMIH